MVPIALAAVLFLFAQSTRAGEDISAFDRLTIEHGLSQSTVQAILQDRDGFMWFGTMDGLNRYDGYSFVVFRHDPARPSSTLSDNDIRSLYEDRSGTIWVATARGGSAGMTGPPVTSRNSGTIPPISKGSPGGKSRQCSRIPADLSGWGRPRD